MSFPFAYANWIFSAMEILRIQSEMDAHTYFPICDITIVSSFSDYCIYRRVWDANENVWAENSLHSFSSASRLKCLMCRLFSYNWIEHWNSIWLQIPQDRTILRRVLRTVSLSLFVCMSTISVCGIIVAIALIVFNIWNNHRRWVSLFFLSDPIHIVMEYLSFSLVFL